MTRLLFTLLLALLAIQRLLELRHSRRNEVYLLAAGGREHGADHFKWMKLLHSSWFAAMLLEVWGRPRPFQPIRAAVAFAFLLLGQALRYAAIRALGRRWSVRILTLPDTPPVNQGIYRYLRHPNYLGVILEIAAVPLIHGAYRTAALYSALNAWLLSVRIAAEEKALAGGRR